MTFKKNCFLAVKSEEGGFYLCRALQNIPSKPKKTKKFKIKWLEQVSENSYKLSYEDYIEPECIIDVVVLVNRQSCLKLAQSEKNRIEKLAQSSVTVNVEETWSEENEDTLTKHQEPDNLADGRIQNAEQTNLINEEHHVMEKEESLSNKVLDTVAEHQEADNCVDGRHQNAEENNMINKEHHMPELEDSFSEKIFDPVTELKEPNNCADGRNQNAEQKNVINEEYHQEDNEMHKDSDPDFLPNLEDESSNSSAIMSDDDHSSTLSEPIAPKVPSDKNGKIKKKLKCSKKVANESEDEKINVPCSKANKKKMYDQVHSCFFCDKVVSKMSRHLENCHEQELDVARILAMPLKSKIRRDAFIELTRLGDYHYNCDVLSKQNGDLILLRRPSAVEREGKTYKDYLPCPHCLGFLLKHHLWSHIKYNCQAAKRDQSHSSNDKKTDFLGLSKALLGNTLSTPMSATFYEKIILTLKKKDGVKEVCTEDPLIVRFGMLLFEKFNVTKNDLIRQNMRRLGRLVLEFRRMDSQFSEATLLDCLQPKNFDILIQAVKNITITELNPSDRPRMKIPSLALKIGHALRKCASLQRGTYLKEGNLKCEKTMKSFLSLMEIEWENRVSSTALSSFKKAKLTKEDLLPVTSDLLKLNSHLDKSIESYIALLKGDPCNATLWRKLSKCTLSRIMIFNKKRSGEIAKMNISDYTLRRNWQGENSEEIKMTMTELEKRLMETMALVYIVGKRERNVPVLLTAGMKKAIDVLLAYRKNITVIDSENTYMFPLFNSNEHERGHDVLRDICKEVELEKPKLITSTKIRKYIATVTQVVNLSENESDWLARHLGHNIRVHREFYRLQESAVELTKVSRLLLAVDTGKISNFSGQKLDDINVEDLPLLSESEDEDGELEDGGIEEIEIAGPQTSTQNRNKRKCDDQAFTKKSKGTTLHGMKQKKTRKVWSQHEKSMLLDSFKSSIKRGEVPGKLPCEEFLAKNKTIPFFSGMTWKDIKYGVYNQIQKVKPRKFQ